MSRRASAGFGLECVILMANRRYRLTVRTEPSQGSNTGSIPVSATKNPPSYSVAHPPRRKSAFPCMSTRPASPVWHGRVSAGTSTCPQSRIGRSNHRIIARLSTSRRTASLRRHKAHIPRELARAAYGAEVVQAGDLLERLRAINLETAATPRVAERNRGRRAVNGNIGPSDPGSTPM